MESLHILNRLLRELLVVLLADFLLQPRVCKSIHSGQTLLNVLFHEFFDKVLRRLINFHPGLTGKSPNSFLDLRYDLVITAIERRRTAQHNIKNDTDTPHVAFLIVVAEEDLGCYVVGRAVHLVHNACFLVEMVRRSEVNHFDGTPVVDIN